MTAVKVVPNRKPAVSSHPYQDLPRNAFWRDAVADANPFDAATIYEKKWSMDNAWIATAGSCFAQHISRALREKGFRFLDVEPAPFGLDKDKHVEFGYSLYSARYGNIYTIRQLLQLAREVQRDELAPEVVWEKDGRYYDAHRPAIEPDGFSDPEEVLEHRRHHLKKVRELFQKMDVFIFTLGLTEAWIARDTDTVFATAPGVIAGRYDPAKYEFRNFGFMSNMKDFRALMDVLADIRGPNRRFRWILTVSPVPLTATASAKHVLQASMYSKSILRAVAGALCDNNDRIDYFPSYEIITNPGARGMFYAPNLRSVRKEGVDVVMNTFFSSHRPFSNRPKKPHENLPGVTDDLQCEDALLEAFGS